MPAKEGTAASGVEGLGEAAFAGKASGAVELSGGTIASTAGMERAGSVVPEGCKAESEGPKDVDKLYKCFWNGAYQTARVVERRQDKDDGSWLYYVHYEDYDRRLDEWVAADRMGEQVERQKDTPGAVQDSGQKMTRTQKRKFDEIHTTLPAEIDPTTAALEHEREEATKVKNIQCVEFGFFEMDTWYYSPFPEEFSNCSKLYMCEFCLKYMRKPKTLERHKAKCDRRHPAGDEIYRHGNVSVFEVDGKKEKVYCQSLCLLSKLFLDHKTLYYDVDPFLFYVMTEVDERGCHVVGYFSKEKESPDDHNLACIMVLPPYQRKRYGRFLISFPYKESNRFVDEHAVSLCAEVYSWVVRAFQEGNTSGHPGAPSFRSWTFELSQESWTQLSKHDLTLSVHSYWKSVLLDVLAKHKGNLSIKDISQMTAIKPDDIITTLQSMGLIKYWKGQHLISVSPKVIDDHLARQKKCQLTFDESKLVWTPHSSSAVNVRKSR